MLVVQRRDALSGGPPSVDQLRLVQAGAGPAPWSRPALLLDRHSVSALFSWFSQAVCCSVLFSSGSSPTVIKRELAVSTDWYWDQTVLTASLSFSNSKGGIGKEENRTAYVRENQSNENRKTMSIRKQAAAASANLDAPAADHRVLAHASGPGPGPGPVGLGAA